MASCGHRFLSLRQLVYPGAAAFFLLLTGVAIRGQPIEVVLACTKNVTEQPFTGRVLVIFSKPEIKDLPQRFSWSQPQPCFAQEVKDWRPGMPLVFSPQHSFPKPLAQLSRGTYSIQAVMDFGLGRDCITSAPNGYSKPLRLQIDAARAGPIKLVIDRVYPEPTFKETDRIKLVDIESPLLRSFHARPSLAFAPGIHGRDARATVRLRAGVLLPKSYAANPGKRYPTIYEIPGFGGTHHGIQRAADRNAGDVDGVEMIYVMLDPSCRLGHHVFADSANNGPYGQALIAELIPHIETRFRASAEPSARFLTGHSSGGWSSLWLQVTYPDSFAGVWSTAPDPVDFRDFQRVDIYAPHPSSLSPGGRGVRGEGRNNIFNDEQGKPRPLMRSGGKVLMNYQRFSDLEEVMGHGGQLGSFEAVFSPRGPDGSPMRLWDRETGEIDPKIAHAWERYDIRLVLERNWPALAPRLAGKLHVYMGDEDNYYLEGATRLLKKSLAGLGSDAVVELFPGRDHSNLLTSELRQRIAREMAAQYRARNASTE